MKHPFLVRLASYGLRTGLLLGALTGASAMVFGTPETLQQSLSDSGAYRTAADTLSTQASEAIDSRLGQSVDRADSAIINETAKQAITPQSLQDATEKNINTTYAWLEGNTKQPELQIDLSPYVAKFTTSLGDQAAARAQGLPACTAEQLRQINPSSVDVFNLPCLPPGVNVNTAKNAAIDQAVASNDFLKNPVLSSANLPKDAEGKTALDRVSGAPAYYQWSMRGPWIFGALAVLSALAILLLMRSEWREAVRKLGRSFLGVGITVILLAGLTRLFFMFAVKPDGLAGKLAGGEFRDVILAFITSLEKAYDMRLLMFGIVYVVTGTIALLMLRFLKPAGTPTLRTTPNSPSRTR